MTLSTISDELFFDELPLETQKIIRRLARSGYLGMPYHSEQLLDEAYEDGYLNGEREAKAKLESELEQILCSKCVSVVSHAS